MSVRSAKTSVPGSGIGSVTFVLQVISTASQEQRPGPCGHSLATLGHFVGQVTIGPVDQTLCRLVSQLSQAH